MQARPPFSLMISKISTAVLAAMAALSFSCASNALASDTNISAAIEIEAVTKNDSMLRSALGSLERSEQQLREKFGKELAAFNEARLKAFQQAFDRASSRRDTEGVASLAAIINAMKSEGSAESPASKPGEISPIGEWEFDYKGKVRRFRFNEDNSFEGQLRIAGSTYHGTWKRSGRKILLTKLGEKEICATLFVSDDKFVLRQADGKDMLGQKVD
jgi:hypothetical protein